MEAASEKRFPVNAKDYKLYEEVGEGVSATVYRALCMPLNEIVAIKVLDLEKCNNDLDGIRREVQTMILISHTNVLQAHCSFTSGHSLWVVMPYMAGGSCLHIMKSAYPEGFEEPVIATVLREVLKALVYLHAHGHIHRDVKDNLKITILKGPAPNYVDLVLIASESQGNLVLPKGAGNILVDFNGSIKLADFGVSACMFDTGDRLRSRNTFVGTPCWMAPEVMQQLHGYDFKADIWSLGITALELAHGHAPFSKYPPMKVLLMTLQNAPPGLDYERDKRFSKSFKEMVALCLVKDPKKRPTSEKLLKHSFFKQGRQNEYIAHTILDGLVPLGDRFKMLKAKESDLLVQNKAMYEDKDQLSQQEYIRGISAWNFNLEDLKSQAALIQDVEITEAEDSDVSTMQREKNDSSRLHVKRSFIEQMKHLNPTPSQEDEFTELHDLTSSLASMPAKPLEALRGSFDFGEDDIKATSPRALDQENGYEDECAGQNISSRYDELKRNFSASLLPDRVISSKKVSVDGDRDNPQSKYLSERNYSGSLLYRQKRDMNTHSSAEDLSEGAIVQHKGRFKVTSADLSPKGPTPTSVLSNAGSGVIPPTIPNLTAAAVFPSLQSILQQHMLQKEEIIKLIKYLEQVSGKYSEAEVATSSLSQISSSSIRERVLNSQLIHLQQRVDILSDELERQKLKNVQLERELNALVASKEEK